MDNAAYNVESAFTVNQIIAGGTYTTRKGTLLSGAGSLVAGTVLGAVLLAAAATVTPGTPVSGTGATVGNGAVGTWTSDAGALPGTWYLQVTVTGATGKYTVTRPDGTLDGVGTIGSAYNGGINGTLADGSNDWLVGDLIPIVVSYDYSAVKYLKSIAAATDGSQVPHMVLAQDTDATSADKEAIFYETAQLIGSGLTLGAGHTIASIRDGLRLKGLVIDD
jgi:hypothetical protein